MARQHEPFFNIETHHSQKSDSAQHKSFSTDSFVTTYQQTLNITKFINNGFCQQKNVNNNSANETKTSSQAIMNMLTHYHHYQFKLTLSYKIYKKKTTYNGKKVEQLLRHYHFVNIKSVSMGLAELSLGTADTLNHV